MNELKAAEKRWNWIKDWLTAALRACVAGLKLDIDHDLSITDLITKYSCTVRQTLQQINVDKGLTVNEWEIDYIFHLEQELWGVDWRDYVSFSQPENYQQRLLQTFHFVLAFYVIERCLKLLLDQSERYRIGRKKLRKLLFGYENGLLTAQCPEVPGAMGPPFFLAANTRRAKVVGGCQKSWDILKGEQVPKSLLRFYQSVTGKDHFCEIVERALIATRKDHLLKSSGKKLPRRARAY